MGRLAIIWEINAELGFCYRGVYLPFVRYCSFHSRMYRFWNTEMCPLSSSTTRFGSLCLTLITPPLRLNGLAC